MSQGPNLGGVAAPGSVRVLISYAHDSAELGERVRAFWFFLRENGIDAQLDVLAAAEQRQDWTLWMTRQVRDARHILVVASPAYRRRGDGDAAVDEGRGVQWEAGLLQDLMRIGGNAARQIVVPVVLPDGNDEDFPGWLRVQHGTVYSVASFTLAGAERLLQFLRRQPVGVESPRGAVSVLPSPSPTENLSSSTRAASRSDFFVSYAAPDRPWARWVAGLLEADGFNVEIDEWDWPPGCDVVQRMNLALKTADRVLALWSPRYFDPASWAGEELSAAVYLRHDQPDRLIPVLVEEVILDPLFRPLLPIDLTGHGEPAAGRILLDALRGRTGRGLTHPFPGIHEALPEPSPSAEDAFARPSDSDSSDLGSDRGLRASRIFISYAGADLSWALWVGGQLRSEGFEVELDVWSWGKASDVTERMEDAVSRADHTVVLLSPAYFQAPWTRSELSVIISEQQRRPGVLIPVLIEAVDVIAEHPVFASLPVADLSGKDPGTTRRILLEAAHRGTATATSAPSLDRGTRSDKLGVLRPEAAPELAEGEPVDSKTVDVLITYSLGSTDWASWVSWQLRRAGYVTARAHWDQPGGSPLRMIHALDRADRVLPIVTASHLAGPAYVEDEWEYAMSRSIAEQRLLPLLVERVALPPLLRGKIVIDVVNLDKSQARERLLANLLGTSLTPSPDERVFDLFKSERASPPPSNVSDRRAPVVYNRRLDTYEIYDLDLARRLMGHRE